MLVAVLPGNGDLELTAFCPMAMPKSAADDFV